MDANVVTTAVALDRLSITRVERGEIDMLQVNHHANGNSDAVGMTTGQLDLLRLAVIDVELDRPIATMAAAVVVLGLRMTATHAIGTDARTKMTFLFHVERLKMFQIHRSLCLMILTGRFLPLSYFCIH